jgi:hypothetical protein
MTGAAFCVDLCPSDALFYITVGDGGKARARL